MLWHVLAMPVYFLGFILFYKSAWMVRFLDANREMTIFNTLMLMCILIGIMCASRIPMTVYRDRLRLSWLQYTLWSFGEMVIFSAFAALYMALIYGNYGYFPALAECFRMNSSILPFAYIILALIFAVIRPDEEDAKEEDLIRFTDNTGRLKLVIAHDVLLYIEAKENYVTILYLDGDKLKEYSLRQSMRGIEELMEKHGIIRCQRSYFVNPRHVTVLRKDKEGFIQAELDTHKSRPVPVSPKYYEQLSKML
jgi:hypothetical protein